MTTKEAFEAWYDDEEITPLPDDYTILGKRYLYMGWCAATTEANKRIAGLENEVIEKCAKVCDKWIGLEPVAEVIRGLKEDYSTLLEH